METNKRLEVREVKETKKEEPDVQNIRSSSNKNKPITDEIIDKEIKQVEATGLNCYKYVFISKSGFKNKNRSNVELIELKELY